MTLALTCAPQKDLLQLTFVLPKYETRKNELNIRALAFVNLI